MICIELGLKTILPSQDIVHAFTSHSILPTSHISCCIIQDARNRHSILSQGECSQLGKSSHKHTQRSQRSRRRQQHPRSRFNPAPSRLASERYCAPCRRQRHRPRRLRRNRLIRNLTRITHTPDVLTKRKRQIFNSLKIRRATTWLLASTERGVQGAVVTNTAGVGQSPTIAGGDVLQLACRGAGRPVLGVRHVFAGECGDGGGGGRRDGGGDGGGGQGAVGVERAAELLREGLRRAVVGGGAADTFAGGGGGAVTGGA